MSNIFSDNPILKIENLNFSYAEQKILSNLNFTIEQGSFVGIIGPNGAGKSTLIRLLAGITTNQNGKIILENSPLHSFERKQLAQLIAYVPQQPDINSEFTVQQIVEMGRFPYRESGDSEGLHAVESALKHLDLIKLRHRSILTLSGGEKQRAIIASALAQQPKILLLDEPTSALDLGHQQTILRMLQNLTDKRTTVVVVMHDINLSAQYCDNLILLDKGEIMEQGSPDQVLRFSTIEKVYGVKVYIDVNPFTKSIYILPYDTVERS